MYGQHFKTSWRPVWVGLAALSAMGRVSMAQVNVSINLSQQLSLAPTTGLGIHSSVYDNYLTNSQVPGLLDAAGVTTVRYPGGGYADIYHWSNPTHPTNWFGGTSSGYIAANSDFGSFMTKLVSVGQPKQAIVTVNYGSSLNGTKGGQPQEAAAWVAYANGSASSTVSIGKDAEGNDWKTAGFWASLRSAKPLAKDDGYNFLRINRSSSLGVKHWEIGNETFGTGYYGGGNGYSEDLHQPYDGTNRQGNANLSPTHYGQQVNAYVTAMRAVDPTIKIGAVLNTPPDDYSWGPDWNTKVLAQCAENINFVSVHWYPGYSSSTTTTAQANATLLGSPGSKIGTMMTDLRTSIDQARVDNGSSVQVFVTELGPNGSSKSTSQAQSLFAADSYATFLDNGAANVDWLELHDSDGSFLSNNSSQTPGIAYRAIQMVNSLSNPGDKLVGTTSGNSLLRVHAALQTDGDVAVLLQNESTTSLTINLSIPGQTLKTIGILIICDGLTTPLQSVVGGLGNTFSVTLPSYTMYEYIFTPVPEPTAAWAGVGVFLFRRRRSRGLQ